MRITIRIAITMTTMNYDYSHRNTIARAKVGKFFLKATLQHVTVAVIVAAVAVRDSLALQSSSLDK